CPRRARAPPAPAPARRTRRCGAGRSPRAVRMRGADQDRLQPHVKGSLRRVNFRKLGWTEIEVSEISLGSWLTYSGGVEREQAQACVGAAFEAGINFFDTAHVYGRGAAESLLGEVRAGHERSSCVLGPQ